MDIYYSLFQALAQLGLLARLVELPGLCYQVGIPHNGRTRYYTRCSFNDCDKYSVSDDTESVKVQDGPIEPLYPADRPTRNVLSWIGFLFRGISTSFSSSCSAIVRFSWARMDLCYHCYINRDH